ncbi:rod shape-determining protein MreC [Pelagerythrobacter rhizovicinus]|uniref:Cell shape-determining protein MreC n=1 Tax=Pelagerythrobacter rhizovicinus TaxID=2268576 RepID=A0A4Q2KLK2_9SPHN|nr:rod shape-determining protein MreC [Pelagerythrobacter rhizovicinus]RXZ66188.1 rod shape-determining protein MreC [Pelagerythrobacter rhizovicinus]
MAPPSSRRSSYSRRAQYGVFTGYVIAGVGALIGAILLALSLWRPASFNGPRTVAQDAVAPAAEASAEVRAESLNLIEAIRGYLRAGSQNAELKEEVELARIRLAEAEAIRRENARLKALLGLEEDEEARPVTVARLIGSTSASARRFAYLGAGRIHGVRVGMPVRSPRGIVGRVLEVGRRSSRVLLLTDSQSVLPVRLADGNVVAYAEGRGDSMLRIRLINLGINPLKKGDVFVTSGAGGYYRPGIAVAIVAEKTEDGALARIISDPAATDYVAVEQVWQPEAVRAAATPVEQSVSEANEN